MTQQESRMDGSYNSSSEALFDEFQSIMRDFSRMRPARSSFPEGLTPSETFVVAYVGKSNKRGVDVTPGLISDHLHASKSAASQLLRSMEDKGLINRCKSDKDARVVVVTLTEKGTEIFTDMNHHARATAIAMVEYVGEEEYRQFIKTIRKIQDFQRKSDAFERVEADEMGGPRL